MTPDLNQPKAASASGALAFEIAGMEISYSGSRCGAIPDRWVSVRQPCINSDEQLDGQLSNFIN